MAGDNSPLFLPIEEARTSVLGTYEGASVFANHGQRIVNGYRLMQPASHMFLGWTPGSSGRHFFVRELRDVKISVRLETFGFVEMDVYAAWCGSGPLAESEGRL